MEDDGMLAMKMDELMHEHGARDVLLAIAEACEFENGQAFDSWEGPEGIFDPRWARIARAVRKAADAAREEARA